MEVIDIGLDDLEPVSFNLQEDEQYSVNFGPGVELLMNDKKNVFKFIYTSGYAGPGQS